ncbi:hypothetical protein LR48_Vigan10g086900 [Vigna angularis]|uniref:Uncharacterized protein n=1 Tax=Phaseolus angularis TaxID=3914 RepID=A0A0L9VJA3_PHAAN|nr:hypothetical protein LR48_Vigan10g086900 [Vigna angularis]
MKIARDFEEALRGLGLMGLTAAKTPLSWGRSVVARTELPRSNPGRASPVESVGSVRRDSATEAGRCKAKIIVALLEDGGFKGEVGDEGGEIGGSAVGELWCKVEIFTGFDGGAFEGVAGGDDDGVEHEGTGNGAEELIWGGLDFGIGFSVKEDFLPFELGSCSGVYRF